MIYNFSMIKCLNFLKNTRKHNKVILLVGSDRVEAFKRYNEQKMNELFGDGNAFILQSGGERGDSGEGDKALDELEVLFANMSLDDDNSGESKVPVREDYSGSLSRKKALGKKDDAFLAAQGIRLDEAENIKHDAKIKNYSVQHAFELKRFQKS